MHLPTTVTFDQQRAALAALGISDEDAKRIFLIVMSPRDIKVRYYPTRDGQQYLIPETDDMAQAERVITITDR